MNREPEKPTLLFHGSSTQVKETALSTKNTAGLPSLTQVQVDAADIVGFGLVAAGIIGIVVQGLSGNPGLLPISNNTLVQITAGVTIAQALLRMLQSGLQNKGVATQTGALTRVDAYISTYVGYGLTFLSFGSAVVAQLNGSAALLGISSARLAAVGAAIGVATGIGRKIQSMLQNSGTAAAQLAAKNRS